MSIPFALTGQTTEDKLKHVETILRRMLKRTPIKATVLIPPTPFCVYVSDVSESGLLGRWVVPVAGKLSTLHLYVGFVQEKIKPTLVITVRNKGKGSVASMEYKEGANTMDLSIDVAAGMYVELVTDNPTEVREISLGMLFEPEVSKAKKHAVVLDEVLASQEDPTNA